MDVGRRELKLGCIRNDGVFERRQAIQATKFKPSSSFTMHLLQISSLILLGLVRGSFGATLADPFTASGNTWSDQTSITTKGSPGFFEATERWDLYRAPEYSVAISPANEADVITAVRTHLVVSSYLI